MYSLFSLHLILWVAVGTTYSQDVIFVGQPSGGNGCTTSDGRSGSCVDITKCPQVLKTFLTNPPKRCGFNGRVPIVCCPLIAEQTTENPITIPTVPVLDISSPDFSSDFVCGRSVTKTIRFDLFKRSTRFTGGLSVKAVKPIIPIRQVIGGRDSQRNAWPWTALLGIRTAPLETNWFCGGALINKQWVLTAAHCLGSIKPNVVRLGEHDYNDNFDSANHQDFDILRIVSHPDYSPPVNYHDLALLQLSKKVTKQTFISPVCLPWGDETLKNLIETTVTLTGWGVTQVGGTPSSILQEVDLTVFPNSKCEENYSTLRDFNRVFPSGIGKEIVCVGDVRGGRDACQGDSGGAITYRQKNGQHVVNGIVSAGYGCGNKDFPGIYANVQYPPHLVWIKEVAF